MQGLSIALLVASLLRAVSARRAFGYEFRDSDGPLNIAKDARSRFDFVYFRLMTGGHRFDVSWKANVESAEQALIPYGPIFTADPNDVNSAYVHARKLLWHSLDYRKRPTKLLPPALELSFSVAPPRDNQPPPSQPQEQYCHGITQQAWLDYIRHFIDEWTDGYGRPPLLKTHRDFLELCIGDATSLGDAPLWLEDFETSLNKLPAVPQGWSYWTMLSFAKQGAPRGVVTAFVGDAQLLSRWSADAKALPATAHPKGPIA